MAVFQRDTEFNELFIMPICGLYEDQAITVTEFKERNAGILTNRWEDTSHGTKGDKIYGMFDPSTDPEIVKENLQEWLCDHPMEVTECISIALRNHERTFSEWFRYVDSCSSPDELALYCLSRKHGIHTLVLNKSYIWTTLSNHLARSDDEIIELCGVNLVFLGPARYGILRKICQPVLQSSSNNTTSASTSSITPTVRSRKTTCHEGGATGRKKRERSLAQGRGKHPTVLTSTSRKRPQTLSESHSQTYSITAPVTRRLRSGLKPIDYVSLNDGFEDESGKPSKKKNVKATGQEVHHQPQELRLKKTLFLQKQRSLQINQTTKNPIRFQAYPFKTSW